MIAHVAQAAVRDETGDFSLPEGGPFAGAFALQHSGVDLLGCDS